MANIATDVAFDVFDTGYVGTRTNDGNGELCLVIEAFSSIADTALVVAWNGVPMLERQAGDDADRVAIFTLAAPATGAQTLDISGFAAARRFRVWFIPTDDTQYVTSGFQNNGAGTAASSGAIATTVGDLILAAANIRTATDPTVVAANDAVQRSEGAITAGSPSAWGWESSFLADDASATLGCSWSGSFNSYLSWVQFAHVAASSAGALIQQQIHAFRRRHR